MTHTMFGRVIGSAFSGRLTGLALALLSASAASCSQSDPEAPTKPEAQETGTLNVPLVAHVGDNTYRLSMSIELFDDINFQYLEVSAYSDETSLEFELLPGGYSSYLRSWQLYRDQDGELLPVNSTLVSEPSSYFLVHANSTSTLSYVFETDGIQVASGTGRLVVDVEVTETATACEPLGNTCGVGAWCPPSELTGRPLECVFAVGPVGIALPCRSAIECAPNLSCFDFGEGPTCGALCLSADFGAVCPSGGTCLPQGSTYGVCVPDGGTVPNAAPPLRVPPSDADGGVPSTP